MPLPAPIAALHPPYRLLTAGLLAGRFRFLRAWTLGVTWTDFWLRRKSAQGRSPNK